MGERSDEEQPQLLVIGFKIIPGIHYKQIPTLQLIHPRWQGIHPAAVEFVPGQTQYLLSLEGTYGY